LNILYLGNWSVNDGLSHSTIRPHLKILSAFDQIESITYISIERTEKKVACMWAIEKLTFIPYYSNKFGSFADLIVLPFILKKLIRDNKIDLIISRSAPAGNYGYLAHKFTKVPFVVESFEPHADYMLDNGVWSKTSLKFQIQKYFENKQKIHAKTLITASYSYYKLLISDNNVKANVLNAPCAVKVDEYRFDIKDRNKIRNEHSINKNTLIGIYVGKFDDLYYKQEAINLFRKIRSISNSFHLILLTNDTDEHILGSLLNIGFSKAELTIRIVKPEEVRKYLSAADFGFCLHRSTKSSIAFSPIKNGEYWANGLPIIIDTRIGDDSELIYTNNTGIVIDIKNGSPNIMWDQLNTLLKESSQHRMSNHMVKLAEEHRNFAQVRSVYQELIDAN
jgi:hypothetical protein